MNTKDRALFEKIVGLLDQDDGESMAAFNVAKEFLKKRGLTFGAVFKVVAPSSTPNTKKVSQTEELTALRAQLAKARAQNTQIEKRLQLAEQFAGNEGAARQALAIRLGRTQEENRRLKRELAKPLWRQKWQRFVRSLQTCAS